MRLINVLPTLAVLMLLVVPPAVAQQQFTASLDGFQEVPAVPTPATGTGSFILHANDMLEYHIEFSGLTSAETVAHFHGPAAPGSIAGPVFGLPAGSPKDGTVGPLTAQQKADLMANLWYVNIHSEFYPGGEIRGQVIMSPVSNEADTWGEVKLQFDR